MPPKRGQAEKGSEKGSGRVIDIDHHFLPRFRQNVTLLTVPIDN